MRRGPPACTRPPPLVLWLGDAAHLPVLVGLRQLSCATPAATWVSSTGPTRTPHALWNFRTSCAPGHHSMMGVAALAVVANEERSLAPVSAGGAASMMMQPGCRTHLPAVVHELERARVAQHRPQAVQQLAALPPRCNRVHEVDGCGDGRGACTKGAGVAIRDLLPRTAYSI